MRSFPAIVAVLMMAACSSSSQPTFTLLSASVDPTYFCPGGANNAPYDLQAKLRFHNGTGKAVTIDTARAQMTVASISGVWLEKVGDRYDAGAARFTPATLASGSDGTLKVTIRSACTSGRYGSGTSSSADYRVTIQLATSAGSYAVTAQNEHEIVAD